MDFLKDFPRRMKSVGRYAILMNNSFRKDTWKQYGIETIDQQVNLIFTVLLFLMEYSLKEENCTIDDIAEFIGTVNDHYYKKEYSYDDLNNLADFIVNVILSNSGSAMYFKAYDYEQKEYTEIHINYIANKIVYLDNGIRRTSYYLTEDGYNMILSTMELENNLKLTVHEMLFKLHLERADYGRAVNDIKNVFDQLRIQTQKIQEAMGRIRQNALAYSVEEYRQIVEENIHTIEETRQKFKAHKELVEKRVQEFEEDDINIRTLTTEDEDSLNRLREIESYLVRSLDEHQKILNEHLDLKSLYDIELENYSNMTMVQRFHFKSELYDKVLKDASLLEHMEEFFQPLFWNQMPKVYNMEKAFEMQKRIRKKEIEDETQELGFEAEEYLEEKARLIRERLEKYEKSLKMILEHMITEGSISLSVLKAGIEEEEKQVLFPSLEIFREIMIELLSAGELDISKLKKERSEFLMETPENFQLNQMVLDIIEENNWNHIKKILISRAERSQQVCFERVKNEQGEYKNIRCSDVELWYET